MKLDYFGNEIKDGGGYAREITEEFYSKKLLTTIEKNYEDDDPEEFINIDCVVNDGDAGVLRMTVSESNFELSLDSNYFGEESSDLYYLRKVIDTLIDNLEEEI